jgi:hypothetical protein
MDSFGDNLDALIVIAATLRAEGRTWQAIGEEVNRSADTVRRWPDHYPDAWDRIYRVAESRMIAEAATEARTTLRVMLRAKRGKYRISAAQSLLRSRDADRAREAKQTVDPETEQYARIYREISELSDEELDARIARCAKMEEEKSDDTSNG